MAITYRRLQLWPASHPPTPAAQRRTGAQFKTTPARSLNLLAVELRRIGVQDAVLEVDTSSARDIRVDGGLRGDARLQSPGVVLRFTRAGQAVTMPCDRYKQWNHNVHALALTLAALRAVDRHGATRSGEQYRGFAALPASTTPALSTEQAVDALVRRADPAQPPGMAKVDALRSVDAARGLYRMAAKRTHPDNGGSTADFQLVAEAWRVLRVHHGVTE